MNNLLSKANKRTSGGAAAVLISVSYAVSRVLGLLRDYLLARHFGIGALTDAYTAAFRIPDLLFTLLVSGAFAVAFIPVLTKHWVKDEQTKAWELSSDILNLAILAAAITGAVAFIFAGPLTTVISAGFDPYRHQLTVNLTRILLATPLLFAVSSIWGSIAQAFNRFLFFSLAGVVYNAGIVFGILFLSPTHSIYGVAYGVLIGAFGQALLQILGLVGLGYKYSFRLNLRNPSLAKVLKLMIPRSIDQGVDQVNYTVQTIIGSQLATGSLTAYYYANNLKNVPLVLFGSAIATAVFPTMAAEAAKGRIDNLIEIFVHNARLILFLLIPSVTAAVIMRGYIVRLLLGFGNQMTASTLGWFAAAILSGGLFLLISRVYYALQDTRTPLYTSLVAISGNIALSFWLGHIYGVAGLAMAQSLVATLETLVLLFLLRRKLPDLGLGTIGQGLWRMLLADTIAASTMYILIANYLPLFHDDHGLFIVGPKFAIIAGAGILAYLVPCYILQLREAKTFISRFLDQVMKPINILNQTQKQ